MVHFEKTIDEADGKDGVPRERDPLLGLKELYGALARRILGRIIYSYYDGEKIWNSGVADANQRLLELLRYELEEIDRAVLSLQNHSDLSDREKLAYLMECYDSLRLLTVYTGAAIDAFRRFSPSQNSGIHTSQRSVPQTRKYGFEYKELLDELRKRNDASPFTGRKVSTEILKGPEAYGRYSSRTNHPSVYHELAKLKNIQESTDFVLVNSGMTAFVVADALIARYVVNRKLLVVSGVIYYELDWEVESGAHSIFDLNLRQDTQFVSGRAIEMWNLVEEALSDESGKMVVIRFDLASNDEKFQSSDYLCQEMLERYHQLGLKKQSRLIFLIDTTLYPCVNLEKLRSLLPKESSVITVDSLIKFHMFGWDFGTVGLVTCDMQNPFRKADISTMVALSGLAPADALLSTVELVLTKEIIELRMRIIAENTITLINALQSQGIQARSIEIDNRFSNPDLTGGLISIPMLGRSKLVQLVQSLEELGIQVDIRTSFGHNTTSFENLPNEFAPNGWTRISVGIEDRSTILLIAQKISALLKQDLV